MNKILPLAALFALAVPAAALTPAQLTPQEQQKYAQRQNNPTSAAAYLDTRGFLRECQQVESGRLAAKGLPVQPSDYDSTAVSAAEQKIVDDAVFKNIVAMLGG